MRVVRLKEKNLLPDEQADALAGHFVDDTNYDLLVEGEDIRVEKPDGSPLLVFRSKVLSAGICKTAYPSLRTAASHAGNRGLAAGIFPDPTRVKIANRKAVVSSDKSTRARPFKLDGTLSNTSYAQSVPSGIIGYFDRYPRIPYCRLTAFNLNHPERFAAALPFIRAIDKVFKEELPERRSAQMKVVRKTSDDFVIHKTAFTTITVNLNWRTAVHKDKGDLAEGFGVMSVLRAGKYTGGYLVFPKFRVAVNMTTQDVLLGDVHEWHGNTPIVGVKGAYERVSCVFYYREGMKECGSAEEELERAKNLGIRAGKGKR